MKKRVLGIIVIAMLVAMAFTSVVSAAGITATPATVKAGDSVAVKVTTSQKVYGMEFTLTYDADKFEYVSTDQTATVNTSTAGVLKVSYAETKEVDTMTFNFKAKTDGTAAFTISAATFFNGEGSTITSETITTASASVTVEKATDNTDNNNNNNNNNGNTNGSTDTEKPTRIPQAGTNTVVYVVAGLAIIAVAAMVVSRKK